MAVAIQLPRTAKSEYETEYFDIDFERRLIDLESIMSIDDVIITPGGDLVESERSVDSSGRIVQFRLQGGSLAVVYNISIRVTTSRGNLLEGCVEVEITSC